MRVMSRRAAVIAAVFWDSDMVVLPCRLPRSNKGQISRGLSRPLKREGHATMVASSSLRAGHGRLSKRITLLNLMFATPPYTTDQLGGSDKHDRQSNPAPSARSSGLSCFPLCIRRAVWRGGRGARALHDCHQPALHRDLSRRRWQEGLSRWFRTFRAHGRNRPGG